MGEDGPAGRGTGQERSGGQDRTRRGGGASLVSNLRPMGKGRLDKFTANISLISGDIRQRRGEAARHTAASYQQNKQ